MTVKKDLFVWMVKPASKKPKKIKLKRLLKAVNNNSFQSQFFPNEKDAIKYMEVKS
tara:strand:- start:1506 stop:1673 length:168 start_codon:yes stop_codon:yes gene_type:complete